MIIVRYGEISLKGKNRLFFEKKLVKNIKDCFKKNNILFHKINRLRGRIIIETDGKCDALKNVFGIVSFSYALKCKAELEDIKKNSLLLIGSLSKDKTFRVTTKRLDKNVKIKSNDIDKEVGALIQERTKAIVNLNNFDFELGVEIINGNAYLFNKRVKGFAGLPLGVEGKVICLVEEHKSLLAAWLIMKRGCSIIPVAFKEIDVGLLEKFSYGYDLRLVTVNNLKEIEKIAVDKKINVIVVNDVLDSFKKYDTNLSVFRPLVSYSEQEINNRLEKLQIT